MPGMDTTFTDLIGCTARIQTPINQITGHIEAPCCYAGQSVGDVHAVQPAAEIIAELLGEPAVHERTAAATTANRG
jgi:hypothetical protein